MIRRKISDAVYTVSDIFRFDIKKDIDIMGFSVIIWKINNYDRIKKYKGEFELWVWIWAL